MLTAHLEVLLVCRPSSGHHVHLVVHLGLRSAPVQAGLAANGTAALADVHQVLQQQAQASRQAVHDQAQSSRIALRQAYQLHSPAAHAPCPCRAPCMVAPCLHSHDMKASHALAMASRSGRMKQQKPVQHAAHLTAMTSSAVVQLAAIATCDTDLSAPGSAGLAGGPPWPGPGTPSELQSAPHQPWTAGSS